MMIWCAAFNPVTLTDVEDHLYAAARDRSTWRLEVKGSQEELLTALTRRQPDLLILHHRFPGAHPNEDPIELVQALRTEHPEMRILYLGYAESFSEQLAKRLEGLGVADCWFGPISHQRLVQLIHRCTAPAQAAALTALTPASGGDVMGRVAAGDQTYLQTQSRLTAPSPPAPDLVVPVSAEPKSATYPPPVAVTTPPPAAVPDVMVAHPAADPTRGLRAHRQLQMAQVETQPAPSKAEAKTPAKRAVETRVLPAKTVAFWSPNLATARLTAHVAAYLSLDPDVDVIALDLDLYAPSMALHLGILRPQSQESPYQLCMSQLFEEFTGGRISRERLDSVLLKVPGFPRLRLLAGLFYTPALSDVSEGYVEGILNQIRQHYPGALILCNLSMPFDCVATYGLLERSHQVIMVGGSDLSSAFHLKRYLLQFQRENWPLDRVSLVVYAPGSVETDTLSAVLGQSISAVVQPLAADDLTALRWIHRPKSGPDTGAAYREQLHKVAVKVFSKIQTGRKPGFFARILGR